MKGSSYLPFLLFYLIHTRSRKNALKREGLATESSTSLNFSTCWDCFEQLPKAI
jgi:hypothetical protein